jgi:cell division protein FtsB
VSRRSLAALALRRRSEDRAPRRASIRRVPAARELRSGRFRRWRVVVGFVALFGVVLGAMSVQVELIERQKRLDALRAEIVAAKERQYSLRRQETLLRSPQDVAEIATTELGMVPPERAVLVAPKPVHIGITTTTLPTQGTTG